MKDGTIKKPIGAFEEMMDINDIAKIIKSIPNEFDRKELLRLIEKHTPKNESNIRAEVILAHEHAEDPDNWNINDASNRLFTIDIFLNTPDKIKEYDPRCIALVRTNLQQAMMWLNKAIYQFHPTPPRVARPSIDDDDMRSPTQEVGKEVDNESGDLPKNPT